MVTKAIFLCIGALVTAVVLLGLFDSGPTSSPSPSPSPESTITPQLASAFPDLVMKTKVSTQTHEDIAKALDVDMILILGSEAELEQMRNDMANNMQRLIRLAGYKDVEVHHKNRGLAFCNWPEDDKSLMNKFLDDVIKGYQ